jgi:cell wall-associated NlpC family hydrolase
VTDGRKRITRVIAALGITTVGGAMLTASPSAAEPDIDSVQERVQNLYHEAEVASEHYNEVREDMKDTRARLKTLRADLKRQKSEVEEIRGQVAESVVSQYQGEALSSTTQVFLSEDPDSFLDQLATVSAYNDQRGEMMANFALEVKQLEMREKAAKRELARISKAEETLAEKKAEIEAKAGKAKDLLGELKAEERARLAERSSRSQERSVPKSVPASGRAGAAVDYAMAQVGDAYVYGAAGPDAFDCSGLTMMAWRQAGVSLPHSSSGQMSSGPAVSQSDLQPGDLVFYYQPVSHVGMYIGNGQIVHAANPESGVEVSDVNSMPYSGAVRPG